MRVICKAISGTGFILVILGIACAGSPSMTLPAAMVVSGAVMVGVSASWEGKWTEK